MGLHESVIGLWGMRSSKMINKSKNGKNNGWTCDLQKRATGETTQCEQLPFVNRNCRRVVEWTGETIHNHILFLRPITSHSHGDVLSVCGIKPYRAFIRRSARILSISKMVMVALVEEIWIERVRVVSFETDMKLTLRQQQSSTVVPSFKKMHCCMVCSPPRRSSKVLQ